MSVTPSCRSVTGLEVSDPSNTTCYETCCDLVFVFFCHCLESITSYKNVTENISTTATFRSILLREDEHAIP